MRLMGWAGCWMSVGRRMVDAGRVIGRPEGPVYVLLNRLLG